MEAIEYILYSAVPTRLPTTAAIITISRAEAWRRRSSSDLSPTSPHPMIPLLRQSNQAQQQPTQIRWLRFERLQEQPPGAPHTHTHRHGDRQTPLNKREISFILGLFYYSIKGIERVSSPAAAAPDSSMTRWRNKRISVERIASL